MNYNTNTKNIIMVKKFISLEWKQFKRSAAFGKSLAIKILMAFGALYFTLCFLFIGFGAFFIIKEATPESDPFQVVNTYLIYWVLIELAARFFLQQLPVMQIKAYLLLPIQRNVIVRYLLNKTSVHFFNFLPLFFFLPFSGVLIYKSYSILGVVSWFIASLMITQIINFTNFLINKNNLYFFSLVGITAGIFALRYFGIFDALSYSQAIFNAFYTDVYWVIIPIALMYLLYKQNEKMLHKQFYLDGIISKKTEKVETKDLTWINRFGKIAPFIKNDIRMIWRNVRPKQVIMTSVFFLFYGLFFFTMDTYKDNFFMTSFAAIFITGGFLLTFGAYVPSWDSEYYKLMMSQNIPYRQYLESKWMLIAVGVGISTILSIPYIYFGTKIYLVIIAGGIFNIGLNSFITLFGGALNRIPIELNVKAKAFSNTQGFNATQLLISLPKMLGPVLLFFVPYYFFGFKIGIITLAGSGLLGIIFRNQLMKFIEHTYQKGKYKTIAAFSEKS